MIYDLQFIYDLLIYDLQFIYDLLFDGFDGDDGALAVDDADVRAFGDVGRLLGDGLPDVTVNLHAPETVGLDGLDHPTLTPQQRIGIAHAFVLTLAEIALGEGPHPEEADEGEHRESDQL